MAAQDELIGGARAGQDAGSLGDSLEPPIADRKSANTVLERCIGEHVLVPTTQAQGRTEWQDKAANSCHQDAPESHNP